VKEKIVNERVGRKKQGPRAVFRGFLLKKNKYTKSAMELRGGIEDSCSYSLDVTFSEKNISEYGTKWWKRWEKWALRRL